MRSLCSLLNARVSQVAVLASPQCAVECDARSASQYLARLISAQQPHNLTAMSAPEPKMLTVSAELWTLVWLHSEDTATGPVWDKWYSLLRGYILIPPKGQRWEVVDVCLSDMCDSINELAEKLSRYTLSTQITLNSVHQAFPFLAPSDFIC